MIYTFRHNDGNVTTVEANTEAGARALAMLKKYGPNASYAKGPVRKPEMPWGGAPHQGFGLSLIPN